MCFLYTEPIRVITCRGRSLLQETVPHAARQVMEYGVIAKNTSLDTDVKVRFNFIVLIVQIYLFSLLGYTISGS